MTWFKVDDQFPDHPKVLAAGGDAAWLFICGGCYCARHLTDGFIPTVVVGRLTDRKQPMKLAAKLVEAGLWYDRGDHFEVHGYLDYNPSREHVETERQRRSEAGAIGAAKRWHGKSHSTSHPPAIDSVDAPVPSRPEVPTEPLDKRRKRRPPSDYEPTESQVEYATSNGLVVEQERTKWLTWCEANGKTYDRVGSGFTTWLHNAVAFAARGRNGSERLDWEAIT